MASISGRVNEANKFLENGHKYMRTGLLKWTPDHDNAANQYQQAAIAFKGAGLHQKAVEAYDLTIKCYLASQGSAFQAAKCMEQAALCCKETGDFQSVSNYYNRAIDVYKTLGELDTAISVMDRAAKALTEKMPTMAADIYIQASETSVLQDRYRQAAEFCNKAAILYIKTKNYQKAANIAIEEINCYNQVNDSHTCNRTAIGLILIYLIDNNNIGARGIIKSCRLDEGTYQLAQNLIEGFEKKDAKCVNTTLNNSFFKHLDTEYAKLARELLNTRGQIPQEAEGTSEVKFDEDDLL